MAFADYARRRLCLAPSLMIITREDREVAMTESAKSQRRLAMPCTPVRVQLR